MVLRYNIAHNVKIHLFVQRVSLGIISINNEGKQITIAVVN